MMVNNSTGQETIVGTTTYALSGTDTQIQGDETTLVGSVQSATVFLRLPIQSNPGLSAVKINAGTLKVE